MTFKAVLTAAVLAASTALTSQAFAHAHLVSATPAAGSTVAAASSVTITYSEGVDSKLSTFMVMAGDGAMIDAAASVDASKKVVTLATGALKPGDYTVDWHVVAVDTHKTEGSFHFTVKP